MLLTSNRPFVCAITSCFTVDGPFNTRVVLPALLSLHRVIIAFKNIGVAVCFRAAGDSMIEETEANARKCLRKNQGCALRENRIELVEEAISVPDLANDGWPAIYRMPHLA